MPEEEQPLTGIPLSIATTGQRFFLCHPDYFDSVSSLLDGVLGYPTRKTRHALSPKESWPISTDGRIMVGIASKRVASSVDDLLSSPNYAAVIAEVTSEEFEELQPPLSEGGL